MKAILFLSIFFSLQAHSQLVRKSDVTTMITTSIKPLQTDITNLKAANKALTDANLAKDNLIKSLTDRLAAAELKIASIKITMDTAMVQLSNHFLLVGKVASINIPILATQIKSYLEGKL